MLDYANQIANTIAQYLPYTSDTSIGAKYQASDVTLSSDKITLTFESSAYDILSAIINDSDYPNNSFTASGFYFKNRIKTFAAYPEDSTLFYAFTVDFEMPHKLDKDDIFTPKGFVNSIYNIQYKVLKVVSSYIVVAYPLTTLTIVTVADDLGYISCEYTEGLNGIKEISDEGSDQLSFIFDIDDYFAITTLDDLDLDFLPYLCDYTTSIKVLNANTFFKNLTDPTNTAYLIVDTTSLVGSPIRSKNNTSDSPYSTFSRSGRFDKNYTIDLLYLLERNQDDVDNQTTSGSDIVQKQSDMQDALTSITRQPLDSDSTRTISSLTIGNDAASTVISEGRVVITYQIQFSIMFTNDIMVKVEDKNTYKINTVKINSDEVNFA